MVADVDEIDEAWPPESVTAVPIWVPPVGQLPDVRSVGPQRKNVTVPAGVPELPDTVAMSLAVVPGTTLPPVGVEDVETVAVWRTVVKHSLVESVVDAAL